MKRYTFSLTKKEAAEFCIRAFWEQQRMRAFQWIVVLAIALIDIRVMPWAGIMVFGMIFLILFIALFRYISVMGKDLCEKPQVMWVENGILKVERSGYGEIMGSSISVIRITRHLLMLGLYQAKKQIAWYPMPLRVFGDVQEREAFLAFLREEPLTGKEREQVTEERAHVSQQKQQADGSVLFRFFFRINEEKWAQLLTGATQVIRSGAMGRSQGHAGIRVAAFLLLLVCMAFTAGRLQAFSGNRVFAAFILFILLLSLLLLKNGKTNPEKRIRRQIKKGLVQNDTCGDWEIVMTDTGVEQACTGKNKTVLPWEELRWVTEGEFAFYFFKEDKRHFLMLPKEAVGSREQASAMLGLCAQKNLLFVTARKEKYWPGWVFNVTIAGVIAGYLAISAWSAIWDSGEKTAGQTQQNAADGEWKQEFNPADYPDYVPLDKQAEVLRSLGFTVPKEVTDAAKNSMEEYGMQAYVEGYPYTWLLSELGMPSYNDEWEITGYSGEVFWFDFEGWDIGTDYIEVLEGMLALTHEGELDGVTNIREDIQNVDWEAGEGSLTVLLEWKGETCSWRMEVENDWIDGTVLGIFNSLLKEEDIASRYYATGDGGQGALVFFGTKEWAKKFEEATGLELDSLQKEPESGQEGYLAKQRAKEGKGRAYVGQIGIVGHTHRTERGVRIGRKNCGAAALYEGGGIQGGENAASGRVYHCFGYQPGVYPDREQ